MLRASRVEPGGEKKDGGITKESRHYQRQAVLTLVGPETRAGQKAPAFKPTATDFSRVHLSDSNGKARLLSVVHSLDTGICNLQTRKFEAEAAKFPNVVVYTISMDIPFAQARYCGATGIKTIRTLSDHRDTSFGKAYGVLTEELRLLSRAVFVNGPDDVVRYVEYLPEVAQHPNHDKALKALLGVAAVPVG